MFPVVFQGFVVFLSLGKCHEVVLKVDPGFLEDTSGRGLHDWFWVSEDLVNVQ